MIGYSLELEGHRWHCIASGEKESLLNTLAGIMQLKPQALNDNPKLLLASDSSAFDICLKQINEAYKNKKSISAEGWKGIRFNVTEVIYHNEIPDIICKSRAHPHHTIQIIIMYLSLFFIHLRILKSGGLLLHAGLIELDGVGVLLAGPGGYGKSTCCKRVPSPWCCLCDDEALIIKARDGYVVHPLPTWSEHLEEPSDKSWDVSRSVTLGGIFFLEQDKVDEIIPMTPVHIAARINFSAVEAFNKYIMHRTLGRELKRDIRIRILNNASDISRKVPCSSLKFSKDGAFWREIEKELGV